MQEQFEEILRIQSILRNLIKLVEENIKNSTDDHYFILDSAAYCEENLKTINKVFLITRVPERISAAKELKEAYAASLDRLHGDEDYKFAEVCSIYGGSSTAMDCCLFAGCP